jgi:putative ABC transport system permease protein
MLLVIQYVFTIMFIITVILVYRQMIYMTNAEMGFDRELVYNISLNGNDYKLVSEMYASMPEVIETAGSSHVPGVGSLRDTEIRIKWEDEPVNAHYFSITPSYVETMGLEIIAGKDMPDILETKNELYAIISERAVNTLGFESPANAVGKNIIVEDSLILEIRGVVKDYKYCALILPLRPLVLRVQENDYNIASLRISTVDFHSTIEKFKEKWKEIDPDHEMEGMLLDDEIRDYYSYFEDIIFTVGFVTFISILISSLGLLGMASYSIQTRKKEIGIRKVFGAKSNNILFTISWSSLKMLVIAAIIAAPITYIGNILWLEQLPLHVSYGAGTIIAGILVVVFLGILSILSQTIKACNSNPAEILKYE